MIWKPYLPQEKALQRLEFEVLFGGSRGPGKTDTGIVWLTDHLDKANYRALVIRKNADDLADWVDRATKMYQAFGVKVAYRPAEFRFPSGAVIKTGHLRDDNAYTKYQGQQYHRLLVEELTQIPNERRYLQLLSSIRTTDKDIKTQIFCTTNPGGVGHAWVKKRFIDPYPMGNKPFQDKDSGLWRIFIPATLDDNPALMENNPGYEQFLNSLKQTDIELYKAWRLGDWDTFAGQFFREFRKERHVMRSFTPKATLAKIGGLDWGRTSPFAFIASLVMPVHYIDPATQEAYDFYRVVTYQEVYGTDKTPYEWGEIISKTVELNEFKMIQADTQIFAPQNDKSISIYDQFSKFDNRFRYLLKPASKDRVGGWENMHNWLSLAPDGMPYWLITENCSNLIKELPDLVHDEIKVEDTAQGADIFDHACDAVRYKLKALKWIDAKSQLVRRSSAPKLHSVELQKAAGHILDMDKFADAAVEKTKDWRVI